MQRMAWTWIDHVRTPRQPSRRLAALVALAASGCAAPTLAPMSADPPPRQHSVLAFPGAEGAGRFALGGRGGAVFHVTHLGDNGPGSLRAAVEAHGPRTVVFEVSGTVALKSPLRVTNGRLTIAGQTAPGDGIALRDQPFEIAADDVVVRFIRSRLGDESGVDGDAIGVVAGHRIVLDHVSASWSTDEALSLSARFDKPGTSFGDVTVQWSFITESLNLNRAKKGEAHGFGTLLRASHGARISFHHNLWALHLDRMPRPGNWHKPEVDPVGAFYDFRSNVFYGWGRDRAGYNLDSAGTRSTYSFTDNAYVSGTMSTGALAFEESSPVAHAHFARNAMNGVIPADPWSLVRAHPKHLSGGLPTGYRLAQDIDHGPVTPDAADTAHDKVLARAGAALVRDLVDLRIVEHVRRKTGRLIDSQREVGGWPRLQSLPAPPDSDRDGLPDTWERAQGLDPADARDGAQVNPATGFTRLEDYLASLVAPLHRPGPLATVHPALHLVGDSTMADKPASPPNLEHGWGQLLRTLVADPARIVNHAVNGRSTKNFRDEGRWAHLLTQVQRDDTVLIQFGHNDARADDLKRFVDPATYRDNLRRFVRELRERGAQPVLATPLARRNFDPGAAAGAVPGAVALAGAGAGAGAAGAGVGAGAGAIGAARVGGTASAGGAVIAGAPLRDTHGAYPDMVRRVAAEEQVPLLDLQRASTALLERLGPQDSKRLFVWASAGDLARYPAGISDNTHFSAQGALAMARLAADAMRDQGLQPPGGWTAKDAGFDAREIGPTGWARTIGGAGGPTLRVTTLAASGPGSLREAIEARGPRTVVFDVGGVIDLAGGKLVIDQPHLTIAGQTAPSPGITVIRGETQIATHDVIVQHLAFRPGEYGRPKSAASIAALARSGGRTAPAQSVASATPARSGVSDALAPSAAGALRAGAAAPASPGAADDHDGLSTVGGARDVIVDHCSFTWATDENLSASGPRFDGGPAPEDWRRATAHNITYSHNLIAEGLSHSVHEKGEHSKGTLIHDNAGGILLYGNVYVSNRERNALFKGGARGAMVNNLIVNPGARAVHYNLLADEWSGRVPVPGRLALQGNVMHAGLDTLPGVPFVALEGVGDLELFLSDNLTFDAVGRTVAVRVSVPDDGGPPLPPGVDDAARRHGALAHHRPKLIADPTPYLPPGLLPRPAEQVLHALPAAVGARPWDRDPIDARILADALRGRARIVDEEPAGALRPLR
jgi:lysophospholipase L1-like esterase